MKEKWNRFSEDVRVNHPNLTDLFVLPAAILNQKNIKEPSVYHDSYRAELNEKLMEPSTTSFDKLTIKPVNDQLENEFRPLAKKPFEEISKGMDLASKIGTMPTTTFFGAYSKQQYNIGKAFGQSGETGGQALHFVLGFGSKFLEGMANPSRASQQMKFGSSEDN